MKINNVGYNHTHDNDFFVDRPEGSGDCLMLILKTACVIETDGREQVVPENSVFIFRKGKPQRYRAFSKSIFSNDWVHGCFTLKLLKNTHDAHKYVDFFVKKFFSNSSNLA